MVNRYSLFAIILLLVHSLSFAQISGPSNVAGYTKIVCSGSSGVRPHATPFGLPFKFWDVTVGVPQYGVESFRPSDIIGDQSNPGGPVDAEKIVKQGGNQAYRDINNASQWAGPLEDNAEMVPGDAYWYVTIMSTQRILILAGESDNSGNYGTTEIRAPMTTNYYATPYAWRDSRFVPVESLGLIEQGFLGSDAAITSDKVVMQGGSGLQLNYIEGTGWDYGFTHIVPGLAYWIVNKHVDHPWDYTYVGVPALPAVSLDDENVITGITPPLPVKTKATVRAISSKKTSISKSSKNLKQILK